MNTLIHLLLGFAFFALAPFFAYASTCVCELGQFTIDLPKGWQITQNEGNKSNGTFSIGYASGDKGGYISIAWYPGPKDHHTIKQEHDAWVKNYSHKWTTDKFLSEEDLHRMNIDAGFILCIDEVQFDAYFAKGSKWFRLNSRGDLELPVIKEYFIQILNSFRALD